MDTQRDPYLEVTYRRGKPFAAYLYLDASPSATAVRSRRYEDGLVVDYAADGRPIGVEVTSPSGVSVQAINRLLADLRHPGIAEEELSPLLSR